MTEHLPECPVEKRLRDGKTVGYQTCICAALRSCEQRVFALHPEWTVTGLCKPDCAACRRLTELITEWEYGYEKGQRDAIAAAVQRMEVLWSLDPSWDGTNWNNALTSALSAIDALGEKP